MAGTGVWRSQLIDGQCPTCKRAKETRRRQAEHALTIRRELIRLMGGEKPYREFTFERYQVAPGNRIAVERCTRFDPTTDNLYLWGPCGVGKTHLVYAAARNDYEQARSLAIVRADQLSRRVRLKGAEYEQEAIDEFVRARVLVLDDLGIGPQTPYARQLLHEILDSRDFADRAGLLVTSPYSLEALAAKLNDDSISSRLAGGGVVIRMEGLDYRLKSK